MLSDEDVEQFVDQGYMILENCFSDEAAQAWVDRAWTRIGYDRDDPATWAEKRVHLSSLTSVEAEEFAPTAWAAAVQLLGGVDRVVHPWEWSDGLIANLGVGDDRPWEPPSADVGGWHKDGDFFRHFLDSPEQGLLTIVLWTDMHHRGGGTFVAPDSVPVVARHLAQHPEGLLASDFDFHALIGECRSFVELTGRRGDVVLMHPFMLHATSQNVLGHGRMISNPPIALQQPMQFDRQDPRDFSAVEAAVLRGLGVDRLPFAPTADREQVVPQRVLDQRRRERDEVERPTALPFTAGR